MSTSLAAQLKRLATPQTSLFYDKTTRASILFDPKEAANKDRETIFDIGYSGLEELISINPSFIQFETTLFDRTAKSVQRTVESTEFNAILNANIKKFMIHLSPYFLLKPAHKCLEWLIRRFNIHELNVDELMLLIIPYHETRIFVRCVQLLSFRKEDDFWFWLKGVHKSGVPLSKQAIFNHAVSCPKFLQFICNSTSDAVKELDKRAHTLQAMFALYCTTVIGTLDMMKNIPENHVICILKTLLKGLSSPVIDFTAASYMITAQLFSKTQISHKLLNVFILKICRLAHSRLAIDAIMLLILLFQTQEAAVNEIKADALDVILQAKWIPSALGKIKSDDLRITKFYIALLSACLKKVQEDNSKTVNFKSLCENLMLEVTLINSDAELAIRCVLDSYICKDKPKPIKPKNAEDIVTISLDSDDEMEVTNSEHVTRWYSDFLKKLERQYPESFDKVVKATMKGDGELSKGHRNALKNVLSFLLNIAHSDNDTNVFENLYHHNSSNRCQAVKYLVKNFDKINITSEGTDLLKDSFIERLQDDNPLVVYEILKFNLPQLKKLVGVDVLIDKLIKISTKYFKNPKQWFKVTERAFEILMESVAADDQKNANKVILAVMPFLLPATVEEMETIFIRLISLKFAPDKTYFFRSIVLETNKMGPKDGVVELCNIVLGRIASDKNFLKCESLIETMKTMPVSEMKTAQIVAFVLLLINTLPKNASADLSIEVFKLAKKMLHSKKIEILNDQELCIAASRNDKISSKLFSQLYEKILENTVFHTLDNKTNFAQQTASISLQLEILEVLITKYFTTTGLENKQTCKALELYFRKLFPEDTKKLEFLANFFVADAIEFVDGNSDTPHYAISYEYQIRIMRFQTYLLSICGDIEIDNKLFFVQILMALNSPVSMVRECALETLQTLAGRDWCPSPVRSLIKELLQRKQEISLDKEQLPMLLFIIYSKKKNSTEKKYLTDLFKLVLNEDLPQYLVRKLLEILKLINSPELFTKIVDCGLFILSQNTEFSHHQSHILKFLITKIDGKTVPMVAQSECAWNFITKSLKCNTILSLDDSRFYSPSILVLEAFTDEVYQNLPPQFKVSFMNIVIELTTYCENSHVISAANRMFEELNLSTKHFLHILDEMETISESAVSLSEKNSRKSRSSFGTASPPTEVFLNKSWKYGVCLLELLQNKNDISNVEPLINVLFRILKKCVDLEEQSSVEYTKQMILSLLLKCCQKMTEDKKQMPSNLFKIKLIVQSIRGTQNPQTHHHALLLLSATAQMVPDQVLIDIMDIFTFMGSSLVRHDDSYSFQIITKIIENIIPIVVTNYDDKNVLPVLRVFSDIILHVPEHRRLPLYIKLINILGSSEYLWIFIGVLMQKHIREKTKVTVNSKGETLPTRLDVGINIVQEFEPSIIIDTCTKLIRYLQEMPTVTLLDSKDNNMEIDITGDSIFDLNTNNNQHLRHFVYVTLQFIVRILASPSFINKLSNVQENDENDLKLKSYYKDIILNVMKYIPKISKTVDQNLNNSFVKSWRAILNYCYDILENIVALLSPSMFIMVVLNLMEYQNAAVRKKIIDLLNAKLQHEKNAFEDCSEEEIIKLLKPLTKIIQTIDNQSSDVGSGNEAAIIQQVSLTTIKLLSRRYAQKYTENFQNILELLTKSLEKHKHINDNVLSTMILCIAEICSNLKNHSLVHLGKYMPVIIKILKKQNKPKHSVSDLLLISIITSITKIIESMSLFLSPYLKDLIIELSKASNILTENPNLLDTKIAGKLTRINVVWEKISSIIPGRVLIPAIDESYRTLLETKTYSAIGAVMNLIKMSFTHINSNEFGKLRTELSTFFLKALQFRADNAMEDDEAEYIDEVEGHVVEAFVALILKLSESSFRPLYFKVYDWAIRESEDKNCTITFYRLSSSIAESLKSLFVLFASDLITNAAKLLDDCNLMKQDNEMEKLYFPNSERKNVNLIKNILKTLDSILLYDNQNFITPHRFDVLMQPLVDQLENELIADNEEIIAILLSCISQLAVAVGDDSLWKQLNYQVMLKTRSASPDIRLLGLRTCLEIAKKLGEDFLPMLPETIPFIAELLEDENHKVERTCQKAVQELEKILGEPLQKYF